MWGVKAQTCKETSPSKASHQSYGHTSFHQNTCSSCNHPFAVSPHFHSFHFLHHPQIKYPSLYSKSTKITISHSSQWPNQSQDSLSFSALPLLLVSVITSTQRVVTPRLPRSNSSVCRAHRFPHRRLTGESNTSSC